MVIYQNVLLALQAAFGDSALSIAGLRDWVHADGRSCGTGRHEPVEPVRLILTEEGESFVYCGSGAVFAKIGYADKNRKGCYYLVWDDEDTRAWYWNEGKDGTKPGPCPRVKVRLSCSI